MAVIQVYVITAAFVGGLAVGGAGAWKVQAWRRDSADLAKQQQAAQDARAAARRIDVAAEGYEARQEGARAHDEAKQQEVIRVITKIEYRDRCLDDDGMRILADDTAASNARRGLAPALPAASSAK